MNRVDLLAGILLLGLARTAGAQIPPASPPVPLALGPLGPWQISGVIAGLGFGASPNVAGAHSNVNALITLRKVTPEWELFAQAGAYSLPSVVATPLTTAQTMALYGPLPVAYALWKPGGGVSLRAGILPSLLGPENVFTFQNANIERGVIWTDLENTVSRAAEMDWSGRHWSGSVQFGDGFYSRRFGAISGLVSFAPRNSDT